MKKPWLVPLSILAIAALAGVAVAGSPDASDGLRLTAASEDSVTTAATTATVAYVPVTTTTELATVAAAPTTINYIPQTTTTQATVPVTSPPTSPPRPAATAPNTTAPKPPSTTRPVTTTPKTTAPPTTPTTPVTPAPTQPAPTVDTTATTVAPVGPDRAAVNVLIAMANDTVDDLATPEMDEYFAVQRQLELLGYLGPIIADALVDSAVTVVYYQPGYIDFAMLMAADLAIPVENVLPYPTTGTITEIADVAGNIIVVIGEDWPTVISVSATTTTSTSTSVAS